VWSAAPHSACLFSLQLVLFWCISAVQLLFLAGTLPDDQDKMEAELTAYAQQAMARLEPEDEQSVVSIEERMTSFDGVAAKESLFFMRAGFKELRKGMGGKLNPFPCGGRSPESCSDDEASDSSSIMIRREMWLRQQMHGQPDDTDEMRLEGLEYPTETTHLIV